VITPRVESEARRGLDYARVRVSVTVDAPDAWGAFREAAAEEDAAWDMGRAPQPRSGPGYLRYLPAR
jgi:hypothetical protein